MSYGNTTTEEAINLCVLMEDNSIKYKIPVDIAKRVAGVESHMKRTAYNSSSKARGLGQVIDYYWRYGLSHIDDGKLGKYLKNNNITNINKIKRYYYRWGYATEMMFFALDECRRHKRGSLPLGVYLYGGVYSKNADQEHMRKYTNYILSGVR